MKTFYFKVEMYHLGKIVFLDSFYQTYLMENNYFIKFPLLIPKTFFSKIYLVLIEYK